MILNNAIYTLEIKSTIPMKKQNSTRSWLLYRETGINFKEEKY
jgi:hypothetical protein